MCRKDRPTGAGFNQNLNPMSKHTRKHGFNAKPFLDEIARTLPTVKTELHRNAIEGARDFLLLYSPALSSANTPPVLLRMVAAIVESLRCCGVSPEGWQAPLPPTELLRHFWVPMIDNRNFDQGEII